MNYTHWRSQPRGHYRAHQHIQYFLDEVREKNGKIVKVCPDPAWAGQTRLYIVLITGQYWIRFGGAPQDYKDVLLQNSDLLDKKLLLKLYW